MSAELFATRKAEYPSEFRVAAVVSQKLRERGFMNTGILVNEPQLLAMVFGNLDYKANHDTCH